MTAWWVGIAAAMMLVACGEIPQPENDGSSAPRVDYQAPTGPVAAIAGGDEDEPRVIFLHGTPGDRAAFADYILGAPAGRRYISIDRPGFGDSAPRGALVSFEDQARAVDPLLTLADGRAPIVVGHSLGGPLALYLAATRPGRVAAVVALAGSADPSLEKIHPVQRIGDTMAGRMLLPRWLENTNEELLVHERELTALGKILDTIEAPVIVVHGTDDALVPVGNVAYLRDRLPPRIAEYDVIEGQDHFLPWNNREAVERAIDRAVERAW